MTISSAFSEELLSYQEIASTRERGRGIKIANKSFDEIWYNECGNQVNFLKFINADLS